MDNAQAVTNALEWAGLQSWVVQAFVVVLFTLVLAFILGRILVRVQARVRETRNVWDDALLGALTTPARVLLLILGIAFAVQIVHTEAGGAIFEAVAPVRDVGLIGCLAWFLVRFIRLSEDHYIARKEADGEVYDRTTLDAIAKLLRLSVLITAALVALQTLGFSISGVLAFGGIGGIAVGFAARDLLANFFGGLTIYLDRPFDVGDWIRSPDRQIEGTVEQIGWRQTRIRTFDKRPLYVPNSAFASIAVENPSRMLNRRIYEYVGVRYDDAGEVGPIVTEVERMLRGHPEIDQGQTLMVNFDRFAASSLDFFVYCFTRTTSWTEYHRIKQDVLLKILAIIDDHGAEVAFPTSTIHLAGTGADPENP